MTLHDQANPKIANGSDVAKDNNVANSDLDVRATPQISLERERLVVDETKITLPKNLDNSLLIRECLKAGSNLLKNKKSSSAQAKSEVALCQREKTRQAVRSVRDRASSVSLMTTMSLPSKKSSIATIARPHTASAHPTRQVSSIDSNRVNDYLDKLHSLYESHLKICTIPDQTFLRPQKKHFPAMSTSYIFGRPMGIVEHEKTPSSGLISRDGKELKHRKNFDCKNRTDILFH